VGDAKSGPVRLSFRGVKRKRPQSPTLIKKNAKPDQHVMALADLLPLPVLTGANSGRPGWALSPALRFADAQGRRM
jgi:hypothetical protein